MPRRMRLPVASAPPQPLPPIEDISGDGGVLMRRAVNSSPKADGDYARKSTYARVHYRAMLENGEVLADSRSDGGEPLELRVGAEPSECVPGWDMALPKMRAGERVVLVCEPRYAFGEAGVAPHIPPMATVRFDIELLSVRDLLSSNNTETVDFLEKYAHVMAQNEISKITAEAEADAKADEEARAKAEAAAAAKAEAFFAAEARAVGENGVIDIASSTEELTPETAAAAAAAAQAQVDAKRRAQQGAAEGGNSASPAAGTPSSTGQGRGWVPSATRVEASHPDGHSWRETDAEIELRVPLPPEATSAKSVSVEIGARTLSVSVLGKQLAAVSGRLVGRLDVEESSWSYEAADETDGETPVLQLDLMKKVRASEQEPLWGYILEAERTAASQQRVQPKGNAAGAGDEAGGDGAS